MDAMCVCVSFDQTPNVQSKIFAYKREIDDINSNYYYLIARC